MYYLYKITNLINNKVYIGVTGNPKRRKYEHFRKKSGTFSLVRLAVKKHGLDNFKFEILIKGERKYIEELEVRAIDLYESKIHGYNIQSGGCPERGSSVEYRSDDKPVCAFGFWFPNSRTAIKTLGMNKKTFYRRRVEGTLHLEIRPLKATIRPKRFSKEDFDKRSASQKIAKSGEKNPMFGKRKPSNKL